jgi:hypothetical protein
MIHLLCDCIQRSESFLEGEKMAEAVLFLAEKHIQEYQDRDAILSQHRQAMKCRDCEDFLGLGIQAFKWLKRADQTIREATIKGFEVTPDVPEALAHLYRGWLLPCAHAEDQIRRQREQGFELRNLEEFEKARNFVEQQVRLLDMEEDVERAAQGDSFDEEFWTEAHRLRSV